MTTFKRFLTLFFATFLAVNVWGVTSNFTNKNLSVGPGEPAWSSTVAAGSFESTSYERGVAWPSGGDPVLTSTSVSGTITSVSIVASTNAGSNKASLAVSVGGTAFSPTSTYILDGTSNANSSYEFTGSASGTVTITVNNANSSKSVWIKSITITTSGGGSTYTVTLSKNGSTSNITGCSGTYTLPTTDEHVAAACEGWAWHCWTNAAYSTGSPTSTAPSSTVITTMSSAGTAYAVYKHTEASGGSSNVTFTAGTDQGSTTTTSSDAMTKGGITISSTSAAFAYDDNYRFYSGGTITISSSGENITSIIFNSTASGTASNGPGNISGTGYSYSGQVGTWTGNAASVSLSTTAQSRATSIVVTTGGGSTTTYTSSPDCTPCDYKVTLTKGEESHGTFTLDKTNGVYNNCTSNFVVTVSGISPVSGYYCTGVTATGDHNEVTGPDGSGNYTVTYTKGNSITSTITANFAPNPTYTVTWSMNGDESNTEEYEEGESIVFPGSADGCDGKVFRGWSATTVAETDVEPTYVTSATMPAHDVTYYAVFAEASGSGGDAAWTETAITDLTGTDIFVIVGNTGSANYALPNNASGTPDAISVTISAGKITSTVANNLKWNISGNSTSGYTFYPNGSTTTWLYSNTTASSSSNTNIRIGSGARKVWAYTGDNQLVTDDEYTDRYLAVQGGSDFRGYTSSTTSATTFKFYAYSAGTTYSGYTTTCGAGISAQNVGWITSSVGQKVKRVINVSAKNFDDATTLTATCDNSDFHLTLGESAVPSGATGLTTTLTVEYTPTAESTVEANVEIVLTAGDKTRTITVNGRSVPDEFLLITKQSSTWYALPANMNSEADQYDGVEVSPNDAITPTAVPVSPSTLIYNLASVASARYADNGHLVRLVGNNNKCLWSNKATTTGKENIQNYAVLGDSNGDNYEWDLRTDDGIHYYVENPHHPQYSEGRRLAYGTKFGMYKEETVFFIVRAGCSSQPGEIVVSPRRVDATFSWVSNTTEMHIDLYTNSEMSEGHLSATASSSPYVFTNLSETTDYWYKLTPGDDTDCAVTGTFKTSGPIIDIVEWQENGVVLFIDKGEINPKIVIDGQEEHGSITGGGEATELFFAKYFEGAGSMKLVSIFNGTKNDISLNDYTIFVKMRGPSAWAPTNDVTLDLSGLGSIKAGQEIIFFSRPLASETALDGCSESFLDGKVATSSSAESNPRWVECDGGTFKRINFNGNDPILLRKSGTLIDVIGSEDGAAPTSTNCLSGDNEKGWAGTVRNMDKGKSPSDPAFDAFYEASSKSPVTTQDSIDLLTAFGINLDDDEIPLTTARCIFFRDKRVQNGDSAVLMNGSTFVTFTNHDTFKSEWYGRSVCMNTAARTAAGVSDDAQATCNSYQDIANMDYNQYYIDWHNLDPGTELSEFSSDSETKEYIIPIDDMRQYACLKLRFQLVQGEEVLTEASQQVPIVVKGDVDTNDPLFSELVIDQSTHLPSYSHSLARCADCDVVVLGAASLTKGSDTDPTDVPEVGNVKVYPGGKLIVPTGTTYTMKSLALRRQEDVVASADVQGTITFKAPSASPAPRREEGEAQHAKKAATGTKSTYFDLRIDPTNWHFISLPYDVNVSDIRFANPEETAIPVLGTDYLLQWYDGDRRAATKNDDAWEPVAADATLKAGLGYIFALPGSGKVKREFRFPMDNEVITLESANKTASPVYGYGCDQPSLGSNHKGWNLVGAPYLTNYLSDLASPLRTGKLIEDHTSPEHNTPTWDGAWTDDGSSLRYIAIPINNGWDYYYQEEISGYELPPFTSYFVQIDGTDPTEAQVVGFNASRVIRSSIVRRDRSEYEEEEDTHPVWCAINLTNPQGETDKTTVLISNDFTDNYDMMNDMVKMRGSYYSYYTRPVLASRNNEGEMAFNALPDSSALAGIPLNFFAAGSGSYTISFNERYGREEVKAVMLLDKNNNQWYNLLDEPYSFTTNRVNDKNRFVLSVRVERKKTPQIATDIENIDSSEAPRKLLINGHVYIQRGNRIYDITGKQAALQ